MAADDLTNVASVKAWLGLTAGPSPNDTTLAALVTAASRAICAWLSRPALSPREYSEVGDGEGDRVYLRQWPVQSIASVSIDGQPIPPIVRARSATAGYLLQPADLAPPGRPQAVDFFGCRMRHGRQNIAVNYTAGYAVPAETQIVPTLEPWEISVDAPYGPCLELIGVVYRSTNDPLTATSGSPVAGQYRVMAPGVYAFAPADAGNVVAISYGYIPQDIAQAATELVAERFRAADRIGLRSKAVGGQETVSFDTSALPATVLALLQPYRRTTF
jgi:hypothetical protein